MRSIVFKSTMPAVITKFTTAALLLLALAACNSGGGGSGGGGGTKKATSIPLEPTNLVANGIDQGIDISWDAAKGATSYTVYYHTDSFVRTIDNAVLSKTGITTTNASITNLANGTIYYLRVEAISAAGSHLSEIVSATVPIPIKPTELVAKGFYQGIDLTWKQARGATSYTVYYHTASFDKTTVSQVDSTTNITTTKASITDLSSGTLYYLRVEAINAKGETKLSTEQVSASTNLQPPTNLKAIGVYKGVELSWKEVRGAKKYTVYYSEASFKKTTDNGVDSTTDITTTKASITDLTNDTIYYLRVKAINAEGETKLSEEVEATADFQAPKLRATGVNQAIDISWDAVKYAASYTIYYHTASFEKTTDTDGTGIRVKSRPDITADNTSITGLTNGKKYYLRAVTNYWTESSHLSKQVEVTVNLQPPTNLKATGVNQAVDLSWNAVKGAASYTVYYHTASFDSTTVSGVQSKADITTDNTIITGLTNGKKYYLRVEAIKADGKTKKLSTEEVTATPIRLAAPTDLSAIGAFEAVFLGWKEVTGATSYTVYYHTASFDSTSDNGVKSKADITTDNTIITGLTNGTPYFFGVIASNPRGNSALSSPIQSATPKLSAPSAVVAASNSPAAVDLSWDAVAGVTNYKIYYAKDSLDGLNGGYQDYASVGGKLDTTKDTSITIGDLSIDTTYYFVVAANYNGQEKAAPEVSADTSYIAELAMGGAFGCVRLNTGSIKCWGYNDDGQLGVGDTTHRTTATSVSSNLRAKQLSAGIFHSCAINLSDKLYCWGSNEVFRLGLSDKSTDRSSPTLVTQDKLAKVSLVTVGHISTCALAGGKNYCWGNQYFGALGNGVASDDQTMDAQQINDITPDVKQFALGYFSGCAIDASDDLWCWGNNDEGQVGDGSNTRRPSPVKPKLQGSSTATMLDSKYVHYCAVDDANKMQCWGNNKHGQLGINIWDNSNIPQYVLASADSTSDHLSNVSKIAIGLKHSCALIKDGSADSSVRCWGWSGYGIIGIDPDAKDAADRLIANADMPDINNAIDIDAGFEHTCVLLADRASVKCWGKNSNGQLGNGKTADSATPVAVKWK